MAQSVAASPLKIPGSRQHRQNPLHLQKLSPGSNPSSDRSKQGSGLTRARMRNSTGDHFAILGINAGTSKQEIKKAYRRLALQYHPDVCKGDHCTLKFKQIQIAYEGAMMGTKPPQYGSYMSDSSSDDCVSVVSEGLMGVNDDSWEDWEEWMGWEGAGTRNYTSHINIHI